MVVVHGTTRHCELCGEIVTAEVALCDSCHPRELPLLEKTNVGKSVPPAVLLDTFAMDGPYTDEACLDQMDGEVDEQKSPPISYENLIAALLLLAAGIAISGVILTGIWR